ncbi:MAG TPA: hypothetical protein VF610_00730 [Segetibacter sp.]
MDNKNKGLADNQEGDFVLNESGTTVNIDNVEERAPSTEKPKEDKTQEPGPALKPGNE